MGRKVFLSIKFRRCEAELILSCPERADRLQKKEKADAPKLNILLSKLEKNLDDLHFAITDD